MLPLDDHTHEAPQHASFVLEQLHLGHMPEVLDENRLGIAVRAGAPRAAHTDVVNELLERVNLLTVVTHRLLMANPPPASFYDDVRRAVQTTLDQRARVRQLEYQSLVRRHRQPNGIVLGVFIILSVLALFTWLIVMCASHSE